MIGKEAFKAVGSFIFRALELALALGLQVIFKKQTGAFLLLVANFQCRVIHYFFSRPFPKGKKEKPGNGSRK